MDKLCKENAHVKELLDTERFIYLGYVVCAFDEKYVREATADEKLWNGSDICFYRDLCGIIRVVSGRAPQ